MPKQLEQALMKQAMKLKRKGKKVDVSAKKAAVAVSPEAEAPAAE